MSNDGNCCTPVDAAGTTVTVNVDATKIVKYISIAGILIVAIIFCSKCCRKMLEQGLLPCCRKS